MFVTRKITVAVGRLHTQFTHHHHLDQPLLLGNLTAVRDRGHARDYCNAYVALIKEKKVGSYVVSTGACATVREFCLAAF